jgi:hypothetical protein
VLRLEGKVHCPNCGIKTAANQKYCRSCGFGLEKFSQLFLEQLPPPGSADRAQEASNDLQEKQRKIERLRNVVVTVFITTLFAIGIGYGAIYRLMIVEGNFLVGGGLALILLFLITGFLLSVWAEELKQAAANHKQKPSNLMPEDLPAAETTSRLEIAAYREPMLSVAEKTTRSLVVSDRNRPET